MLIWLAFWFAFRSKRENMWRDCGILGIIAGIVNAFFDWQTMHHGEAWRHPEYAAIANNSRLLAMAMLIDFVWALFAGSFYLLVRLDLPLVFHLEQTERASGEPPMTPLTGPLWRLGDFGWKLFLITGSLFLLLAIAIGSYALLPMLVEKTLTFSTNPTRPTATPAPPLVELPVPTPATPRVERALPVVAPTTPRVEKALPVPHYQTVPTATPYQTDVAAADSQTPTPTPRKHHTKK